MGDRPHPAAEAAVLLTQPTPTPYDVTFRVAGFPVRVHPLFWVVSAILGSTLLQDKQYGVAFLLMWVAVAFVSILVHELGHCLAYRRYGADGRIWLYGGGGLAVSDDSRATPREQIVIALAGPAAGFVLALAVGLSNRAFAWERETAYTEELYRQLLFINVAWGLVNLLPLLPLDGGRVSREVCGLLRLRHPEATALRISVGAAVVAVAYSLAWEFFPREIVLAAGGWPWYVPVGSYFTAIFFGVLGYESYQRLQFVTQSGTYYDAEDDDELPWRRR